MPNLASSLSYCGPPPIPADLWGRWNFDPLLLALFAVAITAFVALSRDAAPSRQWAFGAAIGVLLVAFVSPLCALTVALFSTRVGHHVLLVAFAAPLLAVALMHGKMRAGIGQLIVPVFLLNTIIFWLWHVPDVYAAALSSTAIYWLMQLTLLGSATLLWGAIFGAANGKLLAALLGTTIQMGMLGALLVFADQPLYVPHLATSFAFGLDPLADQQLAGLIMWVPASLPYLAVVLVRLLHWLGPSEQRAR